VGPWWIIPGVAAAKARQTVPGERKYTFGSENEILSNPRQPSIRSNTVILADPVFLCGIDSLFHRQRRCFSRTMDPLNFKFVDNLRPPCSKCGRPLILTRIEPEEPGCDLRTYYCAACEDTEVIIAAI
jgi:hypothetical protein